ncbi:MAG: class I SAM-dependent methyltransferase, partial [Methylohalobius sp.]|nr:class I SAM-dependent methyltransferase [Methylohalobius sp.]
LDGIVIYNTEADGPIHKALVEKKNYFCSNYYGEQYKSGEIVNGVMHQDLMRLSFEDGSIDLVLSSDVLEHVSDPYKAHR